jgi:hypothetical protein
MSREQIGGLLIQQLEDVSFVLAVWFASYKNVNLFFVVYFSHALSL